MRQNAAAHARFQEQGVTRFNESAFNRGEAMYDGDVDGHRFRHVAKSFQTRVWRDCLAHWSRLSADAREHVEALLPREHGLAA